MSEPKGDRSPSAATPTSQALDVPRILKWVVVLRPIRLRQLLLRCFAAQRHDGPRSRFVAPPLIRKRTRRRRLITQLTGFDL